MSSLLKNVGSIKKRDKARLQPDQFLSIIIDGADQSAFGLAHFMVKSKDDRGHALKVRLIGLLEHNQLNRLRLFTLTEEYPTGANHVVEAVHRFLTDRINQSVFPRTFYIQVDNCTKENKDRFFFSYVKSLIRWKLFDEIVVAFLRKPPLRMGGSQWDTLTKISTRLSAVPPAD